MTTYTELSAFDKLRIVLLSLASVAAQGVAHEQSWGTDYAHKEVKEEWPDLKGPLRRQKEFRITSADFFTLTDEQKHILGFGRWSDEGMWLIPLYAYNYIADGETLMSINGERAIKGVDEIDLDVRFGCIAFGFPPIDAANSI